MTTASDTIESGYKTLMFPVTITAGADKLSASPGATVTTGGANTGTQTTATQTGAQATTTSKNAAPAMTQNAVLAGVAAVVGGVLAM
jgi:hypothetical protein